MSAPPNLNQLAMSLLPPLSAASIEARQKLVEILQDTSSSDARRETRWTAFRNIRQAEIAQLVNDAAIDAKIGLALEEGRIWQRLHYYIESMIACLDARSYAQTAKRHALTRQIGSYVPAFDRVGLEAIQAGNYRYALSLYEDLAPKALTAVQRGHMNLAVAYCYRALIRRNPSQRAELVPTYRAALDHATQDLLGHPEQVALFRHLDNEFEAS
jgi:hypothetical protein